MSDRDQQVVVLGAAGQLGAELCRQLGAEAVGLSRESCDVTDPTSVEAALDQIRPEVVINAAAYTAVDLAEEEPERCWAVNAEGTRNLTQVCRRLGCRLAHVSTDYVFSGDDQRHVPYQESDEPDARGEYARSKLAGERYAAEFEQHLIVRTCGLYGLPAPGRTPANFVETMLRLAQSRPELRVVDDQHCTPSYTRHVARAVIHLVRRKMTGTYHVVNAGETTWYDFAKCILAAAGFSTSIIPITTAEFGAKAPRPAYSVLDTAKYRATDGPELPHWKEAVREYLGDRGQVTGDR